MITFYRQYLYIKESYFHVNKFFFLKYDLQNYVTSRAKYTVHTFRGLETAVTRNKCIHPTRACIPGTLRETERKCGKQRRSYEARVYESMIIDAYRRITLR